MDEDGSRRTIPDMLCFLLAQKKFKQRNSLNRKNKVLLFCFKKQNSTGVQEVFETEHSAHKHNH